MPSFVRKLPGRSISGVLNADSTQFIKFDDPSGNITDAGYKYAAEIQTNHLDYKIPNYIEECFL